MVTLRNIVYLQINKINMMNQVEKPRQRGDCKLATVRPVGEVCGPGLVVFIDNVMVTVGRRHHHFVVEDLRSGQPEDDEGCGEDDGQEAEGERFPRLEGDEGQCEGDDSGGLELEAQQERHDHLLHEPSSWTYLDSVIHL